MTTTLIVGGVLVVLLIALIAITIMVLIKQFKNGGPLHGSIGIITFGVWTFIWGWLKHKGLYLTKVMIVWSALVITPMALVGVFGFGIVNEFITAATNLTDDKKEVKKISGKKASRPKTTARTKTYKKTAYSTKKTARTKTYKKPSGSQKNTARKSVEQYHQTLTSEPQR